MRYSNIKARREVRFTIVAHCHNLFLNCKVEKVYSWGNYLSPFCPEAEQIIKMAREKLGFKKSWNNRDLFWHLQCTWRKMIERKLIDKYTPKEEVKFHYFADKIIATRGRKMLYGFKVKPIDSEIRNLFRSEANRYYPQPKDTFSQTQFDYHGNYEQ